MFGLENTGLVSKHPDLESSVCWEVPNYFAYQSHSKAEDLAPRIISSPQFSIFNKNWRLVLILNSEKRLLQFVGFFVWMMPFSKKAHNISVKLVLENSIGRELKTYAGKVDSNGCFGSWNFILLDNFSTFKDVISPSGILKLICIMEKKTESEKEDKANDEIITFVDNVEKEVTEAKGVDRLVQDLRKIFLEEDNCDATLKVGNRVFNSHRSILIARSPVFSSMFKHDTKENTTGVVNIQDCSAVAFEVFLSYLYTARTDVISTENVFELYYTAAKYQVNDLKLECVEYMKKNLSVENFCIVVTLSLQHGESNLQETAIGFFCDNAKDILKTFQWQKYLRDYPTEANKLYIKAISA